MRRPHGDPVDWVAVPYVILVGLAPGLTPAGDHPLSWLVVSFCLYLAGFPVAAVLGAAAILIADYRARQRDLRRRARRAAERR